MIKDNAKILRLLKTARGQLDGLVKMIEDERDCIEISNQLLACQSVLKRANLEVLKGHFSHCIVETLKKGSKEDANGKISEIVTILDKILK